MSQSREKLQRQVDKLKAEMKQLRQAQTDSDRFNTCCLLATRSQTERDDAARRRKARKAVQAAKEWRCTAWLAIIAMVLSAALCLTMKVKANADKPDAGISVTETQEDYENQKIEAVLLANANVVEDCTVTWYTADTCGKQPGNPAYGITYTGEPVVEHLTCAVDPDVIPLYSDVFVQYADGAIEQLWATDTGVSGEAIDIYTPDYDYAIQCGRQSLTVWWVEPEVDVQ